MGLLVRSGDGLHDGGAQPIGTQRRRIHDQHLTVELDHRPHTDLFAQ
jgi:hypothetical protein